MRSDRFALVKGVLFLFQYKFGTPKNSISLSKEEDKPSKPSKPSKQEDEGNIFMQKRASASNTDARHIAKRLKEGEAVVKAALSRAQIIPSNSRYILVTTHNISRPALDFFQANGIEILDRAVLKGCWPDKVVRAGKLFNLQAIVGA